MAVFLAVLQRKNHELRHSHGQERHTLCGVDRFRVSRRTFLIEFVDLKNKIDSFLSLPPAR